MFYYIFKFPVWVIFKLFFRLRVCGVENVPKSGGCIIVANHPSFLDPVAIGCAVRRHVRWIVQKPVYRVWWLMWFFALTGMVSVNGVLNKCFEILKKGEVIGIFPEGRRSKDGRIGQTEHGVAVLALQSNVPVIPCAILGAYEAYPANRKFPRPGRITVCFDKPLYFVESSPEQTNDDRLNTITSAIMQTIERLISKSEGGWLEERKSRKV